MGEFIDSFVDVRVFLKLDGNSGYWQTKVDKEDQNEMSLTSHHGLLCFIRTPSRLENVPGTFQCIVDIILAIEKRLFALIYLYNNIIVSNSPSEHVEYVHQVQHLIFDVEITLKLKKCEFFNDTINNLGHIISPVNWK